jgi:hypothetical protein
MLPLVGMYLSFSYLVNVFFLCFFKPQHRSLKVARLEKLIIVYGLGTEGCHIITSRLFLSFSYLVLSDTSHYSHSRTTSHSHSHALTLALRSRSRSTSSPTTIFQPHMNKQRTLKGNVEKNKTVCPLCLSPTSLVY